VIDGIMNQRHDLNEYINTMKRSDEHMVGLLKTEMLYDLIKGEYEARQKVKGIVDKEPEKIETVSEEVVEEKVIEDSTDISDSDLLAELDDL